MRFKAQHPISQFIVDFYCHKVKLVVEIDGEIHNTKENKEYDSNRTFELNKFGLKVLRYTNEQVIYQIEDVIESLKVNISKREDILSS